MSNREPEHAKQRITVMREVESSDTCLAERRQPSDEAALGWSFAALALMGLGMTSLYSYALFHTLTEMLGIFMGFGVFVLAWNTRRYLKDDYILLLSIISLFTAIVEVFHFMPYKDAGMFPGADKNLAISCSVAARYLQSTLFLLATIRLSCGIKRQPLNIHMVLSLCAAMTGALLWAVFSGYFPPCFTEGTGPTLFKKASAIVISGLFIACGVMLWRSRDRFHPGIARLILAGILAQACSEFFFSVMFAGSNPLGHLFKILSPYLLFLAIIRKGSDLFFHDLQNSQKLLLEQKEIAEAAAKKKSALLEAAEKQADLERAEMRAQLAHKDKMASIGQLAAGVAHEINNPITFVRSNLETLAEHTNRLHCYIKTLEGLAVRACDSAAWINLAEERLRLGIDFVVDDVGRLLQDCLEGSDRITNIVRDMRIYNHQDTSETQLADINRCCDAVIRIVWGEIRHKVTLKKEYGVLPLVECNPQQIGQVVLNLMVNAAQAIEGQGVIIVRTWVADDRVSVTISDTGCGIPPEHMLHVFEPFFTTKGVGKGTGLGLSISDEIISKHNGKITVESEAGKGSVFTISLPLQALRFPGVSRSRQVVPQFSPSVSMS